MKTGIVVLGHGSRAAVDEANQVLIDLSEMVRERVEFDIFATAFMNPRSQRPGLEQAVAEVVRKGAERVIVAPVFLSNGMHMQKDIPEEVERLRSKYRVEIKIAPHLGADPRLADMIAERIREVV